MLERLNVSPPYEIDDAVLTLTQQDAARLEWPMSRRGGLWLFVVSTLVLLIFFGRLSYLNIVKGGEYRVMAERNSLRSIAIAAPRGDITDRFGESLVQNEPSLDAAIVPGDLPKGESDRKELLERIKVFFAPEEDVWRTVTTRLQSGSFQPILIRDHLDQNKVIQFLAERNSFPGVMLLKTAERKYIDGPVFSPIIGYEGKIRSDELTALKDQGYTMTDSIGKQGIEKSYEAVLRGTPGGELVEVDALGQVQKALGVIAPKKGKNIKLTLDAGLQRVAYQALEKTLTDAGLKQGALIALESKTGAVRALVSYPSYDNNLFARGISQAAYSALANDSSKPLFNRAISGEYPPGSTIKPLLAAAALTEGTITPSTTIESRGGIQIGRSFFGDWKAHGFTDLRRAIAVSSDVYFYSVGGGYGNIRGLGMEKMKEYEERFGWGRKTGIDLPGEQDGFLPTPNWKEERFGERWYIGDDYNASIGQGYVTATPLQIAVAIAAIANGGTLPTPHLVESIQDNQGQEMVVDTPPLAQQIFSDGVLRVVREGMRETVTEGTAQSLQDLTVPVAGKTGTAQFGGAKQTHGWFVSFAPFDNPELVTIVLVEGQSETSTYHAVPITHTVYDWYFNHEKNLKSNPK